MTRARKTTGPFIPGGGSTRTDDSRSKHLSSENSRRTISVPHVGQKKNSSSIVHKIDVGRIRRKRKDEIDLEMNTLKVRMQGYRPPHQKHMSGNITGNEIEKLQDKNALSPGMILPPTLLPGSELLNKSFEHLQGRKGPLNRNDELHSLRKAIQQGKIF